MSTDDDHLLELYRKGDGDAFAALFARYHRLVHNYARMMLRDATAAEDLLQETFLAAADRADRYEARGCFRAWLLGICRHRCLDWIDRRRRRQEVAAESGLRIVEAENRDDAPRAFQRRERLELTLSAMAGLPPAQREAVTLYALRELPYAEIAEVLDCPINTVKTLIRRGRLRLAELLAEADGYQP